MADKNYRRLDVTEKIISSIAGIIVIGGAIATLVQSDMAMLLKVSSAIGLLGVWLACAYVRFKRKSERAGKGWRYPRARRYALAGLVIIPLLTLGGMAYYRYQQSRPPDKVIILIANFDEPDPKKYRVTETVLNRLREALRPYQDTEVRALGRVITEAEGSAVARVEGEKPKAAIVIWGWYGATKEIVPLSVHFELLRPPQYMPELGAEAAGQVRLMTLSQLESFTLQTQLSAEMAYLSLFAAGLVRYAARDWNGAIARFSDALSQTVERVSALDQNIVYFFRGTAYHAKRGYNQAIEDYNQAIKLRSDYAGFYNNRGVAYYHLHDYDRAVADFGQAIKLDPNCAATYRDRGIANDDRGNYGQAFADFEQALKLQPNDAETYNARGVFYRQKGELDCAIDDYNRAIKLKPSFAVAYNNRAFAYYSKRDHDQAISDLGRAIRLTSNNSEFYANRGLVYADKGDYGHAIEDYNKAIKLKPDYAEAYFGRGNAYALKREYDRAVLDYDQAIKLRPDLINAYYARGSSYRLKGDRQKAITDLDRFLTLSDDPELQQQAVEQLKELGTR